MTEELIHPWDTYCQYLIERGEISGRRKTVVLGRPNEIKASLAKVTGVIKGIRGKDRQRFQIAIAYRTIYGNDYIDALAESGNERMGKIVEVAQLLSHLDCQRTEAFDYARFFVEKSREINTPSAEEARKIGEEFIRKVAGR